MGSAVKIIQIGSSSGIILSKDVLATLRIKKGDTLYLTETSDGIHLTPYEPNFARKMEMLEDVMRENRDVLRKLAE